MTAFCGCFDRRLLDGNNLHSNSLNIMRERARSCLTRNSVHNIQEYNDPQLFLVTFDNGAWHEGTIHNTLQGNVGWVSGNPLLVDQYGESLSAKDSTFKIIESLENSDQGVLSETCGSFSAIFWNPKQRRLRLCADKLGLRPVYVYTTELLCCFSTSLRVLRSILSIQLDLDDEGVGQFLYLGQCIAEKTCYKNVEVITPGVFVEVMPISSTKITYYSWNDISPADSIEFNNISEKTHELFLKSIRRRSVSNTKVDAFLTGGMDSRSVVSGLLEFGLKVRGFNYSYPNSADDVLGRMLAEKLGIECVFHHSNPKERLKVNVDYFALIAKKYFQPDNTQSKARLIWSGDGGSVCLGHVYMTTEMVTLAKSSMDVSIAREMLTNLGRPISRLLNRSVDKKLRNMAIDSFIKIWRKLNPKQSCRRIFLYYLLNDQMRHLHHHYEEIDISNIEFEMPFFDMELLEFIVSLPIKPFLMHKLYNDWIKRFNVPLNDVPWQSYPSHEPCPHSLPDNILSQWGTDWYGGNVGNEVSKIVVDFILADKKNSALKYLNINSIYVLKTLMALGINRYNYEANFARRFYEEVSGKFVFDIHG